MRPVLRALALVCAHKALLAAALLASPFTWDTSSLRVLEQDEDGVPWLLRALASRVMVWDAVYYAAVAQRGIAHEHEFAFSRYWDWAALVRVVSPSGSLAALAVTAAALSVLAHAAAVVLLLALSWRWLPAAAASRAAELYIVSPAGVFLVAGYPESLFAALSFGGLLLASSQRYVLAGACFGAATLLRSNGLLWGLVFVAALGAELLSRQLLSRHRLARLASIIVGGAAVGAAFVAPQARAYFAWCPGLKWCAYRVPSIYSYVQAHYWNVGFLHYWVPGNAPNFLLGLPTLALLVLSGRQLRDRGLYGVLAVQLALAAGAVFFWHVQTITRIASCVPGPYWYVAELLQSTDAHRRREGKAWTAYFVVWGLVQTALFGAFLPPA